MQNRGFLGFKMNLIAIVNTVCKAKVASANYCDFNYFTVLTFD